MASPTDERETILRTIETWPIEEQATFARAILERVAALTARQQYSPREATPQVRSTWDALYGAASTGREPPTDEQVAQWLDERRMSKYGQ